MSQSRDKNESFMGNSEPSIPASKLGASIAEMLKEALSDHKAGKGNRRILIQKVGCANMSLSYLSR